MEGWTHASLRLDAAQSNHGISADLAGDLNKLASVWTCVLCGSSSPIRINLRGAMPPGEKNTRYVRAERKQSKGRPVGIRSRGMHFSEPVVVRRVGSRAAPAIEVWIKRSYPPDMAFSRHRPEDSYASRRELEMQSADIGRPENARNGRADSTP